MHGIMKITRKFHHDKKAKNILASSLGMNEFLRASNCQTVKEIWDTLQGTLEGTIEVKRSKLKTVSQKYEMFRRQREEKILGL